ncbi:MAG: DNA polymerase/3'-5' exonuclease PolX [Candidatus Niyogibacteria bacterium]|nr:DNA polymerase/3'-5' exonuclease PolX [Candidatus Niyogibacteria bacterium]
MLNQELAKIFFEMSLLLEMKEVAFKPRAYENAAHTLEALEEDVKDIYKREGLKGLDAIPAVGKGIARDIEDFIRTGRIKEYERLKKKIPVDVAGLSSIEGVGPKLIKTLYNTLKIRKVSDLERAAHKGKLRDLPRMGEKLEAKILKGIEFLKTSHGRMLLGEARPIALMILGRLKKVKSVEDAKLAGSVRRWQETIGDLDFLVIAENPKEVIRTFTSMPEVAHIYSTGKTKTMVRLRAGIDADLRILPKESFGAAIQYFTGSKDHNVALRKSAIKKGFKLNEYGLYRGKKLVAGIDEKDIYKKLGLDWMSPEMRTNTGEIEAAQKHKLPNLIEYGALKGDLQTQTNWTDGANSIEEMAMEAKKMGHEYILITDHTKSLAMTGGADEKKLLRQMKEIDRLNKKMSGIMILKGAEVNIMKDGSLDISDSVLSQLDIVGASIHSHFTMPEKEQTARLIRAIENPHVDIIFHPTGRSLMKREPIRLDFDGVFRVAKKTRTILEINAHPRRLDLNGELVRKAKEYGVKFAISTDAHAVSELHYLDYGIAQARRGWATKNDIINAWPLTTLKTFLKKER